MSILIECDKCGILFRTSQESFLSNIIFIEAAKLGWKHTPPNIDYCEECKNNVE